MPKQAILTLILSALKNGEQFTPLALLERLQQSGVSESDIREAMAYLINEHRVEMTPDRQIKKSARIAMHA